MNNLFRFKTKSILFLVALVCVTAHAQFKPTPYDTNNDATARAFVASQIGAQVAGSNYLNAQQAGAQIGGSNYTTSAQIAGSNFLNAAQVGTQIGGSNYTTSAQIAGSNFLNAAKVGTQIGGSNYTTSAQIAGSNYLTSATAGTQIAGSNYLTTLSFGTSNFLVNVVPFPGMSVSFSTNSTGNITVTLVNSQVVTNSYGTNLNLSTNGIIGVGISSTNPIQPGLIGEYTNKVVGFGGRTNLTTATTAVVASFTLTPGDWDVEGVVTITDVGSTISSPPNAGITPQVAVIASDGTSVFSGVFAGVGADSLTIPRTRVSTPTNCVVFLLTQLTFVGGAPGAYGTMSARRVR